MAQEYSGVTHLRIPYSVVLVMVRDAFRIYLPWQQFCLEGGSLLRPFKNAQVVACTMKINSSYAKDSCVLMVLINTDIMGLCLHPHPNYRGYN